MAGRVALLLLVVGLASADPDYAISDTESSEESYESSEARYDLAYSVKDSYSGNDFGHQESRDGDQTKGSYYVHLPDGRLQKVTYYVDDDSGYVAEVSYEGEARYPESEESREAPRYGPPRSTYSAPESEESSESPRYAPPRSTYIEPESGESKEAPVYIPPPRPTFSRPRPTYAAPQPTYGPPTRTYSKPRPSYRQAPKPRPVSRPHSPSRTTYRIPRPTHRPPTPSPLRSSYSHLDFEAQESNEVLVYALPESKEDSEEKEGEKEDQSSEEGSAYDAPIPQYFLSASERSYELPDYTPDLSYLPPSPAPYQPPIYIPRSYRLG